MDGEAVRNIVQDFMENESEISQSHYKNLFGTLVSILKEENPRLPLPLVIRALHKLLFSSPPRDDIVLEWFDVVKELCKILKNTNDEQVLIGIFEFIFSVPQICCGAFNSVVSKLDTLPDGHVRKYVIISVHKLLYMEEWEDDCDDFPSHQSFSLIISLLNEDDANLIPKVVKSIVRLVRIFLKSDKGVEMILSSQLLPILLEKLKIHFQISPAVFKSLIKMYKESDAIRGKILTLGFSEGVINLLFKMTESLYKYSDFSTDFSFPLVFLKEIAKDTRNIGEEVWSHVVVSLVSLMATLEPSNKVPSEAKDLLFETLKMALADVNAQRISNIIKNTTILPCLAGILNYSSNTKLIERSKTLLQMMEITHPYLVSGAYIREGVYAGLCKTGSTTSQRYRLRRAKTDFSQLHNLGQLCIEFKKKMSCGSGDTHEVALRALKEINKVDGNGNLLITSFEFITSGFAGTFLIYLLDNEALAKVTTLSKKRSRSLSIWEEDDADMEEDEDFIDFRVKCFLSRFLKSGEDVQDLVNSLAHMLGKALAFVRYDSTDMCVTHHKCVAKSICLMMKSDPRHDYMLLAHIVSRACAALPSLEAEWLANSNYNAQLQGVRVFSFGIKEYRATSLPKGAMQSDMFNHVVYENETPVPDEVSASLVEQYPFVLSLDIRKQCLDECIDETLFEGAPNRPRKQIVVNRQFLLLTARAKLEAHCSSATKFSTLYVKYEGEQGSGRGPTTEFFTLISLELQKNDKMWRGDVTTGGLFPRPWASLEKIDEVCSNFKLLGQVMAIALKDGRLLDIHLSQAFYKLAMLKQEPLSLYDVCSFDVGLGLRLLEFNAIVQARKTARGKKRAARQSAAPPPAFTYKGATFRDMGLDYVVPGYELDYSISEYPGQKLGLGNLHEYIRDLHDATVGSGVLRQIAAFRSGFHQIMPLTILEVFRADEMDSLLCGQSNIDEEWTSEYLHRYLEFEFQTNEQNPESALAQEEKERIKGWVIGALMELKVDEKNEQRVDERIEFLKYATATSRLPRGGVAKLNPPLRFIVTTTATDEMLPTVMTCVHLLTIPRYSSQKVTKDKIVFAITHGQGHYAFA